MMAFYKHYTRTQENIAVPHPFIGYDTNRSQNDIPSYVNCFKDKPSRQIWDLILWQFFPKIMGDTHHVSVV